MDRSFDEDKLLSTIKSKLKKKVENFIFSNPYTMNYINDKFGTRFFKQKFDFTMEILFALSDKYSTIEEDGRKECLNIKEVQKNLLKSDTFGMFTREWDYKYQTIRRYIKKSRVLLPEGAYNIILDKGTKYIKYQGIKESSSFSEELMRVYMRYIFNAPFEKANPSWLKGVSVKGGDLELDGYNELLGIAFECDGPDHYDVNYIMKQYGLTSIQALDRLRIQKENDRIKNEECARRGIILIRLRLDKVGYSGFQSFIESEYEKMSNRACPHRKALDYKKAVHLIRSGFLGLDFFI